MKGIVLAGGTGSRLYPLTKVTNKHLLPVGKQPMIYYPIQKLLGAGIQEILIVTGIEHMGAVVSLLGSGHEFSCEFTYKVQDQAGGIAEALGLARHFVHDDQMAVILGDNIFQDDIGAFAARFRTQGVGARLLLKQVDDPQRFGVAAMQGDKIIGIEEKPKVPKSNYAVTGVYFYDSQVFEIIRELKPSHRNELEITDVNNAYLQRRQLYYDILPGWWTDAGTFPSLNLANQLLLD